MAAAMVGELLSCGAGGSGSSCSSHHVAAAATASPPYHAFSHGLSASLRPPRKAVRRAVRSLARYAASKSLCNCDHLRPSEQSNCKKAAAATIKSAVAEAAQARWQPLGDLAAALLANVSNVSRRAIISGALATITAASIATSAVYPPPAGALSEENLLFLEAWRTVDRAYIDKTFNGQSWFKYREEVLKNTPMNTRQETYSAIRTMLSTLDDPFTRFLEPEKYRSLKSGTSGAVTGVGLEVGFNGGRAGELTVVAPVVGGPADRAGIAPGDAILNIDGVDTTGMGLYDAAQRLQGPVDTQVMLKIRKNGTGSELELALTRENISLNPVTSKICTPVGGLDKRVGYIRLSTFNNNSAAAVRKAIEMMKEGGADAYILDIRNNSGGLFPAGVEIARMWLDVGDIVFIADNMGIRDSYQADGTAIVSKEPLAVLVNKGTASASEILAGALKDNKRAVILGDKTFGKGLIQSVFELSDGSGLAVTVARYETPAHININKVGVAPDAPLPGSYPMTGPTDFCEAMRTDLGKQLLADLKTPEAPALVLANTVIE